MGSVAKLKEKEKKGLSFQDALKKSKKTETKKSTSKVPEIETPKEVQEKVDAFRQAKAKMKEAEAEKKAAEDAIIEFGTKVQDADGFKGNFRTSYKVKGTDGKAISFVTKNSYSINPDDSEEIEEIVGEDAYDDLFVSKPEVKLKQEVLEDEKKQAQLMDLIGEKFPEFFEVKDKIGVVDGFNQMIYRYADEEKLKALRVFVRPYKPTLR